MASNAPGRALARPITAPSPLDWRTALLIRVAPLIVARQPLPRAVSIAGESYDVHLALSHFQRRGIDKADPAPRPAPRELINAAQMHNLVDPTVGDVGETLFEAAKRDQLFHQMQAEAEQKQEMLSDWQYHRDPPTPKTITPETRRIRDEIANKHVLNGARPIGGNDAMIVQALVESMAAEQPWPETVRVGTVTYPEGANGPGRLKDGREVPTIKFLSDLHGSMEPAPTGCLSRLPFIIAGDSIPLGQLAEMLLAAALERGHLPVD